MNIRVSRIGPGKAMLLLSAFAIFGVYGIGAEGFKVEGSVGLASPTMSVVFDSALGERITAASSDLTCRIDINLKKGESSGDCVIPLKSISVDGHAQKSEHFYDWATNKKSDPEQCQIKFAWEQARAAGPIFENQPATFSVLGKFTVCGRARDDQGKETVTGNLFLFPPGVRIETQALRIKAKVEGFNRERYGIGPKFTEGWVASVQRLAPVVGDEGTVDVTLFARPVKKSL